MKKLLSIASLLIGFTLFVIAVSVSTSSSTSHASTHRVYTPSTSVPVIAEPTPTIVLETVQVKVSKKPVKVTHRSPKITSHSVGVYTHTLEQGGSPSHQTVRVWETL